MPPRGSNNTKGASATPTNSSADLPATDALIRLLDGWARRKVVVVGDFMLDRNVYGNASRMSPDAPVPVLAIDRIENAPGGAANVCAMLAALRCDVAAVGVVGKDPPGSLLAEREGEDPSGEMLRKQLIELGCDVKGLIVADDRQTTVKFNLIGLAQHRHPQKMFRADAERREPIPPKVAERLIKAARKAMRGAAALCLEDYHKGVLTEDVCQALIATAAECDIPVLVDPASIPDYSKYRGATCITPNRNEASAATGLDAVTRTDRDTLDQIARKLLRSLKLEAVVLTLDKQGALLARRGRKTVIAPTEARQVYDVTGAGDMVLAMLAAALANAADFPAAVSLANVAAGIEVERFGVQPIALDEILLALLRRKQSQLGKVRLLDELLPELRAHRGAGKRIAFTNGCFDVLHAGHVAYLRAARRHGDLLVVGVNSDGSIRRLKGDDRPVNPQDDRLLVLSELESIDYLIVFDDDTPMKLLDATRPDVLVKGGDYTRDQVIGGDFVEQHGGRVEIVPLVKGRSTTSILRKMKG